jgi:branched-chain amino acid transport system substrate-binding protein
MKRLAVLCAVALALVASRATAADEPYIIYGSLPSTGSGAFLGSAEIKTVALIEKLTNASGGIGGRQIHFEILDDATDPQQAVQITNGFLAKHAPVMIGPALTATCRAIEPSLKDAMTAFCFSPGVHPDGGASMFSAGLKATDQMQASMRYWRARGWTKVGFISSTDASGQDGENSLKELMAQPANAALKVVDDEHFNITDMSVAAQIAHLKASGAQVIWCQTTGAQMSTVLRGANDAGLTTPIFVTNGNMTQAQMKQYDAFFPAGLYFAGETYYARAWLKPGPVKTAVEAFYKAVGDANLPIEESQADAWDSTMIVIDALRHLGLNATAPQVRSYIAGLTNYAGIDGMYDFKAIPQRGIDDRDAWVMHWDSAHHQLVILGGAGGTAK